MKKYFLYTNPFSSKIVTMGIMSIVYLPISAQVNQHSAISKDSYSSDEGWAIKDPFKSEAFIENKGQFNKPDGHIEENVLYGINNGALKVYFKPSGLSYHITNIQLNPKYRNDKHEVFEKIERYTEKHGKEDERLKKYFDDKSAFVNILWEGANPNAELIVSDKVHETYSYPTNDGNGNPIVANAYKKLTYKNIYPNIDVEYYFTDKYSDNPKTKLGVEYNIVVHPGGDLSQVKMKYSGMQNISLNQTGNIIIEINDGAITDHAPDFSYVDNENNQIKTKFILQDQTVSFDVPRYAKTQKLVIDPYTSVWSVSPGFTTANDGYTIRIDYNHNVYVMGGGVNMGGFPFTRWDYQVKKFNPAGALQWTATVSAPSGGAYGDMVVLRDGKAIVGFGYGNFSNGYILAPSNGAVTTKAVAGENEFGWRLYYNLAVNNGVLWYGGGSDNGKHLGKTDTTLAAATIYCPWTTAGNTEDICYLTQDPAGSFVYITNASNTRPNSSATAAKFCKSAVGSPGTAIWKVNEPTNMTELGQGSFMNGGVAGFAGGWATGVNGMAVCGNRIYTYDGNNIRAYNDATGAIVNSATSGGAFDKYSGLDVDNCCRVYVGVKGIVKRYSSSLVFDASFTVTGDVYDLKFDPQDDAYIFVTGKGFVQKLKKNVCPTCISATKTDVSGCTLGTGTVSISDPSGTAPYTYSWNTSPVQTTKTISGLSPGTYIVTVSDAASPCPLTWKDTIVIGGTIVSCGPTVTAIGGSVCPGTCVNISATGASTPGPFTYAWSPAGPTGANPSVCPTITTTYTVIATDAANATASTTAVVTVNSAPTISITGTTAICKGSSTTLTAMGGGTYSWNTGEVTTAITVTPTANPTTYTVTASNGGCTGTASVSVTVNPIPTPTITGITTICAGQSTALTATGGGSYNWSGGLGTNPAITVSPGSGTTTYTVIVTNGGCTAAATAAVTVATNFIPIITGNTAICDGASTTLATTGGGTYTWSTSETSPAITVTPGIGTTSYSVTVANGLCSGTASLAVTVSANPTPVISGNLAICSGQSTTLTATGGGNYLWSTGIATATITLSPTSTTPYTVTVLTNGCTGSASAQVTVNTTPTPIITGSTGICTGQSAVLTSSTTGPYNWSTGESTNIITVTPSALTNYSVSVTLNGCTGTAAHTVMVTPQVKANITGNNICFGQSVTLKASGGGNYLWNTSATTSSITETPSSTGTYSVIVSVGGCADTATYTVKVNPLPTVIASGDTTILYGQNALLKSTGGGTYQWIPPTGLSCSNCANPTAAPTATTQYCVIIKDTAGCTDSACVRVIVDIKCGFEGELFVPNGFSPNGDGQNDILYVRGVGITGMYWAIYDRWGERVFETTDPKQGWNGKYKGKDLDPAVFVYYLKATCITGDEIKLKGNVAIIK